MKINKFLLILILFFLLSINFTSAVPFKIIKRSNYEHNYILVKEADYEYCPCEFSRYERRHPCKKYYRYYPAYYYKRYYSEYLDLYKPEIYKCYIHPPVGKLFYRTCY
jgi:hypothetical protein